MSDFLEGSPVNQIDLHIHSDASDDGDWSVERIIDEAHGLGIGTLAITDHNRTAAIAGARAAADRRGIELISGIEIDCCHCGVNLHLLGYGIDSETSDFEALHRRLTEQENGALNEKLRLLARQGIELDSAPLIEDAAGKAVTGEQIAEALLQDPGRIDHPLLRPYRQGGERSDNPYVNFYWDWFHQGKPCFVAVHLPTLSEMLALIHRHGGVAVLAHPGVNLGHRPELIDPIVACGIDGIEVYNNYHSAGQMALFGDLAQSRRLVVTCGSDFHGKTKPAISLGQCQCPIPEEGIVEALLAGISAAKAAGG